MCLVVASSCMTGLSSLVQAASPAGRDQPGVRPWIARYIMISMPSIVDGAALDGSWDMHGEADPSSQFSGLRLFFQRRLMWTRHGDGDRAVAPVQNLCLTRNFR